MHPTRTYNFNSIISKQSLLGESFLKTGYERAAASPIFNLKSKPIGLLLHRSSLKVSFFFAYALRTLNLPIIRVFRLCSDAGVVLNGQLNDYTSN